MNRTVRYAFCGEELSFALTHALFSSYNVDVGTTLLLKTIAKRIDLRSVSSLLDVGCGVGVIGICLARKGPHMEVLMQDRDAMAVAFSRENGRRNRVPGIEYSCGLALSGLGNRRFDLIASNWPAKAGQAVLADFCRRAPGHLTEKGMAAVVIVLPLADGMERLLREAGHEILHSERAPGHAVFHFRGSATGGAAAADRDGLAPYHRGEGSFRHHGVAYGLSTVFGLPDFDTIGYQTSAMLDLLHDAPPAGNWLFWNPGQGHVPAFLLRRGGVPASMTLCSRDILELEASGRNLAAMTAVRPLCLAMAGEEELATMQGDGRFDLLCAVPHPVPGVRWQEDMLRASTRLLAPSGKLCISGTSTEIGRFLDVTKGLRTIRQHKEHGVRAALLVGCASGNTD